MKRNAAISVVLILGFWLAGSARPAKLAETQRITHLLNRMGFGPRPGDVERVEQMGVSKYLEQQLHPEQIDDSLTDVRLSFFPSLHLTTAQIQDSYPDQQMLARKLGLQPKQAQGEDAQAMRKKIQEYAKDNGLAQPQRLLQELMGQKIVRAVYSERQLQEVMADFWYNHFNIDWSKNQDKWLTTDFEMNAIRPNALGKFKDLLMATAKSPAMLFYLDNHLSAVPDERVAAARPQGQAKRKSGINENYARELMELHTLGVDGGYTQKDVQEVARALTGWTIMNDQVAQQLQRQQQQLQRASQQAQLQTLQQLQQQQRAAQQRRAQTQAQVGQAQNGKTAQQEIAELRGLQPAARVARGKFIFRPLMHDTGQKVVLGYTIKANGGIEDGEQVIDILAHHPSTARFIATKLVRRFVSDNPPQSLVDRVAATFTKTDGDIREMLRVIFTSDEFYAPEAYQAKMKSPFELAVSSMRLLQATTDGAPATSKLIGQMGEQLYQYQAPTGFPDNAAQWMNEGALLERINFGIALTANRIQGTRVVLTDFDNNSKTAALYLGSPEFQKR
jgi:uncharacterized protein (DUF1800 family)